MKNKTVKMLCGSSPVISARKRRRMALLLKKVPMSNLNQTFLGITQFGGAQKYYVSCAYRLADVSALLHG